MDLTNLGYDVQMYGPRLNRLMQAVAGPVPAASEQRAQAMEARDLVIAILREAPPSVAVADNLGVGRPSASLLAFDPNDHSWLAELLSDAETRRDGDAIEMPEDQTEAPDAEEEGWTAYVAGDTLSIASSQGMLRTTLVDARPAAINIDVGTGMSWRVVFGEPLRRLLAAIPNVLPEATESAAEPKAGDQAPTLPHLQVTITREFDVLSDLSFDVGGVSIDQRGLAATAPSASDSGQTWDAYAEVLEVLQELAEPVATVPEPSPSQTTVVQHRPSDTPRNVGARRPPLAQITSKIACPQCGAMVRSTSTFCTECGSSMSIPLAVTRPVTCAGCGASVPEGAKFCGECGSEIRLAVALPAQRICPNCRADLPEEARFCTECGTSLVEGAASPPPRVCSQCGHELKPDDSFCRWCGQRFS